MKAWPTPGVFPMLAHQGGWDEALLVVGPLAVIGLLLWLANRRVTAQLAAAAEAPEPPSSSGPPAAPDTADR